MNEKETGAKDSLKDIFMGQRFIKLENKNDSKDKQQNKIMWVS